MSSVDWGRSIGRAVAARPAEADAGAALAGIGQWLRRAAMRLEFLLPLLIILGAWEAISLSGLFPDAVLVPPERVFLTMIELTRSGELGTALEASLRRVILGFGAGSALGLIVGIILGLSPKAELYVGALFQTVRQIPTIAWVPLLIMVFGIQETFKIVLIAKAAFFPVALNTLDGVRGVSRHYRDVARVFGFSRASLIRKVVIPAALPSIVTGLRLGLSRSWMVLVAAELFASSVGIGHMMDWGRQLFQIDIVMVGVIVTGTIGFLLDFGLRRFERRFSHWRRIAP